MTNANDIQHGGNHYKSEYSHWDLVCDLSLCYYIANATKYMTRHRKKNGLEDVEKGRHYVQKKLDLIDEGRDPGPCESPLQIQLAKAELLNRFADANGIEPESDEFKFIEYVALAQCVDDYICAVAHASRIIEQYGAIAQAQAPKQSATGAVRSDVAALIDRENFTVEGWYGPTAVYWKCKKCRLFFAGQEGQLPSQVHTECVALAAAEPTPAYVDQGRNHGNYGGS